MQFLSSGVGEATISARGGASPAYTGKYLSVWRRDAEGRVRFIADLGNSRAARCPFRVRAAGGTPYRSHPLLTEPPRGYLTGVMVRSRKALSPLRLGLALAFLCVILPAWPAAAQERVAKLKSAPQDYRGREIRLEGEVLEIRGISPRSERGLYRLVDESDPVGVMVRTDHLPNTGGPFQVRAHLAPELLFWPLVVHCITTPFRHNPLDLSPREG